jgi:hypothetical protein
MIAAGQTSIAGGDRNGCKPGPSAIGGPPKNRQVEFFTLLVLLLIGLLKITLQDKKKLANELRVHCIFFSTHFLELIFTEHSTGTHSMNIILNIDFKTRNFYRKFLHFKRFINCTKEFLTLILDHKYLLYTDYDEHKPSPVCVCHNLKYNSFDLTIVSFSLQGKRTVDERILEDGSNENKRRRGEKPKLRYADVANAGYIMIEIRASNGDIQLSQPDYDQIESSLAYAYVNLPEPRPKELPKIFQMGLSQGGLWVGAKDEFTHQFMLVHVPTFSMPPGTGFYQYEVFGPDNRPFKYFRTSVPVRFWGPRPKLEEIITAFHPELTSKLLDRYGVTRTPHLRISTGMENPNDIVKGYFPIVIEMDENLGPVLGRLGGVLEILSTKLKLVGGGIERYIVDAKNAAAAAKAAAKAEAAALLSEQEVVSMELESTGDIPTPPPPPPAPASIGPVQPPTPGLIPPPPALLQMRPRTPSPRHSPHNDC